LTAFLFLAACDQKPTPLAATPCPATTPYQRFIPVPRQPENVQGVPWSGAFALDTKTGNLCFTYGKSNFPKNWQNIPECVELFATVPDTATSPQGPLGIRPPKKSTIHYKEGSDEWDIPVDKVAAFEKAHPKAIKQQMGRQ